MTVMDVNPQVAREYLKGNRGVFALMTCVLALTFVIYGLYGGLTRVYTVRGDLIATEPLVLPADIVIYQPDWVSMYGGPLGGLEDIGKESARSGRAQEERYPGQAVNIETPFGYRMVWSLHILSAGRLKDFTVVRGHWPAAGDELMVPEDLGVPVGTSLPVQYWRPLTLETVRVTGRVVGLYNADWTTELPWIALPELTGRLLGTTEANLLLVYEPTARFRRVTMETLLDRYGAACADETVRVLSMPVDTTGMEPPRWVRMLGGKALFDTSLVGPRTLTASSVAGQEARVQSRVGFALVPIMITVLSVVIAILTLVVVNVFIGQQRTIGVWRSLGVSTGEVGRLYSYSILAVGIIGSVLGAAFYVPILMLLNRSLDQPLPVPWSSIPLWLAVILFLGAWAGHVARALYTASSIRSFLNNETRVDWWAVIRFGVDSEPDRTGRGG